MLLVSYEFLFFLAVLLALYYLLPGRFQWPLLLAASVLFYLSGGAFAIVFLITTTVTTWFLALRLEAMTERAAARVKELGLSGGEKRAFQAAVKQKKKRVLIAGLILNFGLLAVLKYTNFFLGNVDVLFFGGSGEGPYVDWLLPLGISYYTFQATGYLIDVYHKKIHAQKNLARYALFVSFFPQIVQGPISRFDELAAQLTESRRFDWLTIRLGLMRMLWGFFKKLVAADRIAPAVAVIVQNPDQYQGIYVWIGMFAYMLQMFADFTGGIDIVIGAAQLFGIRLPENFNRPFSSRSLAEFWRRWHMTLMRWLREYIFFPVSTSRASQKLSGAARRFLGKGAGRRAPLYFASVTVWLITGIWHGASWNFVAWGLANCAVLLISQECSPLYRRFCSRFAWTASRGYAAFEVARTYLVFCMIEMFEYYSFDVVFSMFGSMFFGIRPWQFSGELAASLGLSAADWIVVGLSALLMFAVGLAQRDGRSVRERIFALPGWQRFFVIYGLFLAVLVLGVYGQGYDASQFIYNQF